MDKPVRLEEGDKRPERQLRQRKGFLLYMGLADILVMWPGPLNKISFPHPKESPYEICV